MVETAIERLENICEILPQQLADISNTDFEAKPAPTKWSKKEILGHLIDSATNNHQRFVRAQFEELPIIFYDQDNWVKCGYHQTADRDQLIDFWQLYNKQLVHILKQIPEERLQRICVMQDKTEVTLEFLIDDYVRHLLHHLNQILNK